MSESTGVGSRLGVIVLLSAWLGAAGVVGAVVAPAAFAVLPTRTLAGALVGRVLPWLFWSGAVVGVLAGVAARRERRASSLAAALCIAVACLVAQLAVAPRIEQVRVAAAGPIDALARADARRIAFDRLHAASVVLLGIAGIAAAVTLGTTMRAVHGRGALTFRESHDDG